MMININFIVDEDILARVIISKSAMPTELANYLWGKYKVSYKELQSSVNSKNIDEGIITELKQHHYFKQKLREAYDNCTRISKCWEENYNKLNEFLTRICKCFLDLQTTAYIVSPKLNSGINIGENKFIWGHKNGLDDANYDIVYLVHESLHSYFPKGNLNHAVIEDIADIELCKYLNNSQNHYSYHDYTQKCHIQIFPFWNLFLNRTKDEILQNQENEGIYYDIDNFEQYREKLCNLNINEFVDFVTEHSKDINFKSKYEIIK